MRSPVDIHLAVVQPVTPFAQRGRRQTQGGGVLPHAHPAPVRRLDVHRPERLDRAIAHVGAHAETKAGAPFPALFLEPRVAADDAVPPDIPPACGPLPCRPGSSASDRTSSSSDHADGNTSPNSARSDATLQCKSATRIGAPCSRNVSNSPKLLHAAKEPDMPRNCTTQSWCRDRTLTRRPWTAR